MAGKRKFSGTELVKLVAEYYTTCCKGNLSEFTFAATARYISKKKGVQVGEQILRRYNEVVEYFETAFKDKASDEFSELVIFQSLDIDAFISKNNNLQALKTSLYERDQYYAKISERASILISQAKELKRNCAKLLKENQESQTRIKELEGGIALEHKEKIQINKAYNKIKDIIYKNVYPSIADELLKEAGLLKSDFCMINPGVTENYISDDTSIIEVVEKDTIKYSEHSVIQGLFEKI